MAKDDNSASTDVDDAPTPPKSSVTTGPWASSPDTVFRAAEASMRAVTEATEVLVKALQEPKLGSNGGDGGGMENRVKSLEDKMTEVKVALGRIETRLDHIEQNMLTKGYAAILALCVVMACGGSVLGGTWWLTQQYLAPIAKTLPK